VTPSFSIVVPTFNRPQLLPRAVRSVLAQTRADWELLVVNDGDQDITPLVAEACGNDPRVRVFRTQGRRGAALARNSGIDAARGDIVAFLDDDDEYHPDYLAAIEEAFRTRNLDFAWTGTTRKRTTSRGTTETEDFIWDEDSQRPGALTFVLEIATSCGLAIRRSCLQQHGGFDAALRTSEDRDLLFRLISHGCRYASIPRPLVSVHVQRDSGLSEWRRSVEQAASSARDDEIVLERHRRLVAGDRLLRRSYLQRVAGKYYRSRQTEKYWATLRTLAEIRGLSFKLLWRGMVLSSRRLAQRLSPNRDGR